jgi:hypothetical protein
LVIFFNGPWTGVNIWIKIILPSLSTLTDSFFQERVLRSLSNLDLGSCQPVW